MKRCRWQPQEACTTTCTNTTIANVPRKVAPVPTCICAIYAFGGNQMWIRCSSLTEIPFCSSDLINLLHSDMTTCQQCMPVPWMWWNCTVISLPCHEMTLMVCRCSNFKILHNCVALRNTPYLFTANICNFDADMVSIFQCDPGVHLVQWRYCPTMNQGTVSNLVLCFYCEVDVILM